MVAKFAKVPRPGTTKNLSPKIKVEITKASIYSLRKFGLRL